MSTNTKTLTPIETLGNYILFTLNIKPVKVKSNKGFMLYQIPTASEIQHLTTLVESLNNGWKLIESDEEWNRGTKVRNASIYIGHADSKLDIKSLDDFVALDS